MPGPASPSRGEVSAGPVIGRMGIHAIKAMLELAQEPTRWRSVSDLSQRAAVPAPSLEQLVLRLRRAGLLVARRGRTGGYRLAVPAESISLASILAALQSSQSGAGSSALSPDDTAHQAAAAPEPAGPLVAATASGTAPSGRADGDWDASDLVAHLLEQRLWRILRRELQACNLAELLHDWHSARALLDEEAGLLIG